MPLKPLGDRVLLQRHITPDTSSGGIAIPDAARKRSDKCTVVAVGPGRVASDGETIIPMSVKPGDVVLLPPIQGTPLKIEDKEHVVVREEEILCVLEP